MKLSFAVFCLLLVGVGCKDRKDSAYSALRNTGWVSSSTVEVESVMTGTVTAAEGANFPNLSSDQAQQEKLVDIQVKFAKGFFHDMTMQLNQVPEKISIRSVKKNGQNVSVTYSAVIDILVPIKDKQPTLATIGTTKFAVPVPENPVGLLSKVNSTCTNIKDPKALTEDNYYYYFAPKNTDCRLPLTNSQVTFTKIYQVPGKVYPEYNKLMLSLNENGVGFHAAIVPDTEDENSLSRYHSHMSAFASEGLVGVPSQDQTYTRFIWKDGPAAIVVDVFNPTKADPESIFKRALGKYEYVFFNGHSAYGTRDFVADRSAFSSSYQIVVLHSCRSYAYYARQIFQAKSSAEDPTGYALADVIATGETSFEWDSPEVMLMTLRSLLTGVSAVAQKNPASAPDWITIASEMNEQAQNVYYGISGVRTNVWKP